MAFSMRQFLTVAPLFAVLIAGTSHGQNLISNGNFEAGYNSGWNHLASDGGAASYSEETTEHYEGLKALKVQVTNLGANPWSIQSMGPNVSLEAGKDYTLTFWAKSTANGTNISTLIQGTDYYENRTHDLTTAWAKYTWTISVSEAYDQAASNPSIRLRYPELGTVTIDDIRLEEVIPHVGPYDITITPATQHQTMVGFGGALTWYSDWMYYGNKYDEINQLMFDDLGLDIVRFRNTYYPENYPTNKVLGAQHAADSTKKFFEAAKAINPEIQVLLSSWSPPANLKSNGQRTNGGTLTKDADGYHYEELAQYWVDTLDQLGWNPDYISFQNEPGWVASWDSCIFDPTETATNAGYAEASEAIWHAIKDRPNTPKMIGSEAENMNAFFDLNTATTQKSYFDVNAYHSYNIHSESLIDSSIAKMNQIRNSHGERPNWMTEFSKADFDWIQTARIIHNHVTEANAAAYVYWKLAWTDADGDDYMIGLTNTDFSSYTIGPHYYTLKHFAKHVDRGDTRIEVGGSTADIKVSGYLSADGNSITLVAINKSSSAEQINLVHGGLSISSIAGYQSTTGSYYQTMSGLSTASPVDLPASSITTLVLGLSSTYDSPPRISTVDITDNTHSGPATVGSAVTYTLTFSEDMDATTISASDFGNAGTASYNIGAITETATNSGVFNVQVTPTSVGTLKLRINSGAVLKDAVGNDLDTTTAILDLGFIPVQSIYISWSGGPAAEADSNSDGIANVLAWALGAADTSTNARPLLPTFDNTSDPDYVIFTYRRRDAAHLDSATSIAVQYGSTLETWVTATHDGDNVIITPTNDHYGDGVDRVEVKFKRSLEENGRIFSRLEVTNSP